MQGNPSARSRRANRSPQHNHGSSLATSLIVWIRTRGTKINETKMKDMNESTSSHSCFLRNVPHLHLQRSHNRDQRSKRHSKVSLRRQLQQPDQQIYRKKLCTAGSLTGPRNDDRIFCLYCRSISDHKKYNVCIYLYRYQKQHIKDTKETSQNKESHKEQEEQLRECKNYRMKKH